MKNSNYTISYHTSSSDFFHRFWAAFLAISFRFFDESFLALAGPPFLPPNFPRATAAGFFLRGFSADSSVAAFNTSKAVIFSSFTLLDRLSMVPLCHRRSWMSTPHKFKLTHYPPAPFASILFLFPFCLFNFSFFPSFPLTPHPSRPLPPSSNLQRLSPSLLTPHVFCPLPFSFFPFNFSLPTPHSPKNWIINL